MANIIPISENVSALHKRIDKWRRAGLSTAIVPTMGALHDGHLSLVDVAHKHAERVVVSIFVNPTQFAAGEDLNTYPSDDEGDLRKLKSHKTHLAYIPDRNEIYSDGYATTVRVAGPAIAGLEDRFRPHFFDGVATVVAKLLIQANCDFAVFGEKDYQQLRVVTRLTKDLNIPTQIIGSKTIREESGLAMSSRNAYLSDEERTKASLIFEVLSKAAEKIKTGNDPKKAASAARGVLTRAGFKVDYLEARNAENLQKIGSAGNQPIRLLVAAHLGKTRLIDNLAV